MITEMDRINFHLLQGSNAIDLQNARYIDALLKRYKDSTQYSCIRLGYNYYHNQNDINLTTDRKLKVLKSQQRGQLDKGTLTKLGTTTDYLSHDDIANIDAVSHPFMKDIVDEKVDYLMAKPFSINTDDNSYNELLQATFNKKLRNVITESVRESINSGCAWIHPYFSNNTLSFKLIPTKQLYPVYDDQTGELIQMLHFYFRDVFIQHGDDIEVISQEHIDLYDNTYCYTYARDIHTRKLEPFGEPTPLLQVNEVAMTLKSVPFVKLQYNEFEEPLICYLKSIIDDYDKTITNGAKTIRKLTENILVLKKMGGTNLEEVIEYLNKYGILKARGEGEVDLIKQTADSLESLIAHANNTKSNIYKFSKSVDINSLESTQLSGVALKILYTALDLDVSHIEENLQETLVELLEFINLSYELANKGSYHDKLPTFVFNRSSVINESEELDKLILLKSNNLISDISVIERTSYIQDTQLELERLAQQRLTNKED